MRFYSLRDAGGLANIKKLIADGLNVNEPNDKGESLLHVACHTVIRLGDLLDNLDDKQAIRKMDDEQKEQAQIIEFLIASGANVNARDKRGQTPLHTALESYPPVGFAARILLAHGADVNAQDAEGRSPIFCGGTDDWCARLLCEHGADLNLKDNHGMTPLIYQAGQGKNAVLAVLLERGADVNQVVKTDIGQLTALGIASFSGRAETVTFLLSKQADPNLPPSQISPLEAAHRGGHPQITILLREAGARGSDLAVRLKILLHSWRLNRRMPETGVAPAPTGRTGLRVLSILLFAGAIGSTILWRVLENRRMEGAIVLLIPAALLGLCGFGTSMQGLRAPKDDPGTR